GRAAFGAQATAGGADGGRSTAQCDGQGAQKGAWVMGLTFAEICIDARDATALGQWWAQALGWPHHVDSDGDVRLTPPPGAGPPWIFLAVPEDKVVKNRVHLDFTPDD